NLDKLPEGTTVTDVTPEGMIDTTKPGDYTGKIEVEYPDGSKETVDVPVHVVDNRTDADKYDPNGQDVTVKPGEKPDANDGISNKDELPEGTDIHWKDPVDTTTPGDHTGVIEITYPDGSKDHVEVIVHVVKPEQKPEDSNNDKDVVVPSDNKTPMNDNNTDHSSMGHLPQTGAQGSQVGLLGALLAAVGGVFTFSSKKHRKED
ncbi:MAG: Rib/alpha-like domain-containing protein, partial [Aerococcus sp.]|nr:Rib/alpha-like domain-containing protein [Aerococcus sp.]